MPLSEQEIGKRLELRRRGRTDLYFLCKEVLGYKDVDPVVHQPSFEIVQKFDKYQGQDYVDKNGRCWYTPVHWDPHQVIPASEPRDRMLLDARSHLKTTIQTIGHSIQWVLNFPDLCELIVHAAESKAIEILQEIKWNFTNNADFMWLYPEYCPKTKQAINNFGTSEHFTVPNRRQNRRHHTIQIGSMSKKMASSHFDLIKYSDIVDETTVTTPEQLSKTKHVFHMGANLRVGPNSWRDIEGTIYDLNDLYCELIDTRHHAKIARGEEPDLLIAIRGAYRKDVEGGQTFAPDEVNAPYLLAKEDMVLSPDVTIKKGHKIPWWPVKDGQPHFTEKALEDMRYSDEWIFACQMLLNPAATGKAIPFDPGKIQWVSEAALNNITVNKVKQRIVTVDTASTINKRSNDSVLTLGWTMPKGDLIIRDIVLGKWLPDQLLETIFDFYEKHHPDFVDIEETEFVRGLMSSRQMIETKRGYVLPIRFLPKETDTSKQERIMNALQPPFNAGRIKFAEDLPEHIKDRLKSEMSKFPSSAGRDDVLDTLADQFYYRTGAWEGPDEYEAKVNILKAVERAKYGQQTFDELNGEPQQAVGNALTGML